LIEVERHLETPIKVSGMAHPILYTVQHGDRQRSVIWEGEDANHGPLQWYD